MEQFFDRDVNPIEDYNTFTWNGIRKTTKSTSNSPFESGDGQNAVIFIGTNDVQKIGFQATDHHPSLVLAVLNVGAGGLSSLVAVIRAKLNPPLPFSIVICFLR